MSGYRGRPNVNANFLANLNTIPSAEEQIVENYTEDLSLFTNTQFFDFDMGEPLQDYSTGNIAYSRPSQPTTESKPEPPHKQIFQEQDAIDSFLGGYDSYDFTAILQQPTVPEQHIHHSPTSTVPPNVPIPLHTAFSHDTAFSGSSTSPGTNTSNPSTPQTLHFPSNPMNTAPSAKRKSSIMESASPESLEESSRLAAEEDKRRRNTAASARFRIKKKQREQALEKSAKEMSDKVSALESKINQLEMENKWLKNLITEKNMGKKDGGLDISELFNAKFSAAASAPASILDKNKTTPPRA